MLINFLERKNREINQWIKDTYMCYKISCKNIFALYFSQIFQTIKFYQMHALLAELKRIKFRYFNHHSNQIYPK